MTSTCLRHEMKQASLMCDYALPTQKTRRLPAAGVILLLWSVLFLGTGCGAFLGIGSGGDGEPYREIDGLYLPVQRTVPHPDSVQNLDKSFEEIERVWSVTFPDSRSARIFKTRRTKTFATLWAKELAMSYAAERAHRENMPQAVAERFADDAAEEYLNYVKVVVHMFADERYSEAFSVIDLSRPGTRIQLRTGDGNVYEPAMVHPGMGDFHQRIRTEPGSYYRDNAIYFLREVDGTDILEDARELRLQVITADRSGARLTFRWYIDPDRAHS